MGREHVAIVGGGFTGTLLAINLLRHEGPSATLIERRPSAGPGVAYPTLHPEHAREVPRDRLARRGRRAEAVHPGHLGCHAARGASPLPPSPAAVVGCASAPHRAAGRCPARRDAARGAAGHCRGPAARCERLRRRRSRTLAAVALANKNARMIWAMMASGERYREPQVA